MIEAGLALIAILAVVGLAYQLLASFVETAARTADLRAYREIEDRRGNLPRAVPDDSPSQARPYRTGAPYPRKEGKVLQWPRTTK